MVRLQYMSREGSECQPYAPYWLYHLKSSSYVKSRPLTGVWNPDLTGNQELNNLLIHVSNFVRSLQNFEITGLLLTTRSRQFTINGAKVTVNSNFKLCSWYDQLQTGIWSYCWCCHIIAGFVVQHIGIIRSFGLNIYSLEIILYCSQEIQKAGFNQFPACNGFQTGGSYKLR